MLGWNQIPPPLRDEKYNEGFFLKKKKEEALVKANIPRICYLLYIYGRR